MVINESNSQLNSFIKGMNSDTSFDQVQEGLYIYGQNIRITKNQSLGGFSDYSSMHEGIVAPVFNGVPINWGMTGEAVGLRGMTILSVKSVDNMVLMATTAGNDLNVYRFFIDETTNFVDKFKLIWRADDVLEYGTKLLSTVLYKELDNVIKFYIATGTTPIVCLRVDDQMVDKLSYQEEGSSEIKYVPIDDVINNRIVPESRIKIENVISGRLLASQVLYTYRYYNKYGNTTQLSPLTNKIQVIDPSRTKEQGNAEGTETSIGFTLSIDIDKYRGEFDRLQVYRLLYIKPGLDAEVCLIYDGDIKEQVTGKFILNDVGIEPLQQISMEEFAAMSGVILIPKVIEQNQEYMFCGNIKDDTIIKNSKLPEDYSTALQDAKFKLVEAKVLLSKKERTVGEIPDAGNESYTNSIYDSFIELTSTSGNRNTSVTSYLEERGINSQLAKSTYDNIFTSSLLRSLRRGETYKYAIVFYDKFGRRTDVMDIGDVEVPEISDTHKTFGFDSAGNLVAYPIGVNIKIPQITIDGGSDQLKNIIGCLIVRRSSSEVYLKTLLLVALARPVQQGVMTVNYEDWDNVTDDTFKKSPFYPTGILSINNMRFLPTIYFDPLYDYISRHPFNPDGSHSSETYIGPVQLLAETKNSLLFQIFSSEIDLRRNDVASKLNISDARIVERQYLASTFAKYSNGSKSETYQYEYPSSVEVIDGVVTVDRRKVEALTIEKKQSTHWIFDYFINVARSDYKSDKIKAIKDVKMANWDDGFTNVIRDDNLGILTAISKYKQYTSNIDKYTYNNWVSFGKYDFRPGQSAEPGFSKAGDNSETQELIPTPASYKYWFDHMDDLSRWWCKDKKGFIGPGPSCLLMVTENDLGDFPTPLLKFYTSICNIEHTPKLTDVEADEFMLYYGFGNYFNLKYLNNKLVTESGNDYLTVFDGDVYITPHEFTTMYKSYYFEAADTLQSTLMVSYIPLESKINTYFDYGMNMRNTMSANLLYEPGSIDGVTTQERPAHQYNMIYSDNDSSNDMFTLISTDENETNSFKQRAYYSELKTNGEFIDNFLIFKAACFIDVDSKYGQITNMLTDKNMLYYWQDHAFGKFSVNERSLINDQNNNTIMLGQAGILSRYDYISTKYGMRLYDFCARSVEQGVYWVDVNNKAIVAASGDQAVNYGERANVQNIINNRIDCTLAPQVDYDLQNNEVLCKCFGNDQIVFDTKYNIATSVYTREYDSIAYIKNHIYGLKINGNAFGIEKYNYLEHKDTRNIEYLSPLKLEFVVNPMASITKVYDSQLLVPVKRDKFITQDHILNNTKFSFETDIVKKYYGSKMEPYTDREGNIIYNIPRYNNQSYGNRIRGKWMRVNIENSNPSEYFTISHMITKFRQSFS